MSVKSGFARFLAGGLAAAGAAALPASAQADMSGKTVQWVIPFSETGGSAKWANFFAPLPKDALPGNPNVVVKFMPGAGSTKGANWFQRQKHKDGTLLFGSSGSTQFPYLLGDPRVRYEYKDWIPVMATGTGGVAYLDKKSGANFDGTANKLKGIRASVCHDTYSAGQGVEHDDLNVLCLGGRIVGISLAREVVRAFLGARYDGGTRFARRLSKVLDAERHG
jgi:hypothetical protein